MRTTTRKKCRATRRRAILRRLRPVHQRRRRRVRRNPRHRARLRQGRRRHAVRLSESRLQRSHALLSKVLSLAKDSDAFIRFQVAFSLGEVDDPRAAEALAKIARRDAADVWIRTAVLSSALNLAEPMIERLLSDSEFASSNGGRQFLRQLALVVGGRGEPLEVKHVLKLLETKPAATRSDVRQSLVLGLGEGLRRSRFSLHRFVIDSPSSAALLDSLIRKAKGTIATTSSSAKQRQQAIEMLVHGGFGEVKGPLASLLDPHQSPAVQLAAVHALAGFEDPDAAKALIDAWPGLLPAVRGEVVVHGDQPHFVVRRFREGR